jgi:pyruvate-formate lyase
MEVGINVLRGEQLTAAQRNPNRHGHTVVRVFGFSSQFVSLSLELQHCVIEKCRHDS